MSLVCIVLAGGLGTRLRPVVADRPKCLAPVGAKSFLELQLAMLQARGMHGFLLSLGHMAAPVVKAIEPLRARWPVDHVIEPEPLGTGGAILHAMRTRGLREAFVTNGDTWLDADLGALMRPLDRAGGERLRMACIGVADRSRYGGVELSPGVGVTEPGRSDGVELRRLQRVARFVGKGCTGAGLINAGFYRIHIDAFEPVAGQRRFSLEADVLPALADHGALGAVTLEGRFIDIGVPDDYRRFCAAHA